MTYLFIADLHLSPDHPRLVRGFFDLLEHYKHRNTQLYILGDWFNAWIGDDDQSSWLSTIIEKLKDFTQHGNQIYFQVGNRDFALGQKFLDQFSGQLLADTDYLNIDGVRYRIEHGDALCTDDVSYQRFKKIMRNPLLLDFLKRTPLKFRKKLANGFRKKSHDAQKFKSYEIMDVNQTAVENAIKSSDVLIHGHTHRANIHDVSNKKRIVLGDWKEDAAYILEITNQDKPNDLKLKKWLY